MSMKLMLIQETCDNDVSVDVVDVVNENYQQMLEEHANRLFADMQKKFIKDSQYPKCEIIKNGRIVKMLTYL